MQKDLNYYKKLLPERISVLVEKNEDGSLWATIKEIPFCYTQASSASELTDMLNDAVFTHLEIPAEYKNEVGFYVPISESHARVEEMVRNLISIEKRISAGQDAEEIFSLTSNELCAV